MTGVDGYERILVGSDGSERAARAVERAVDVAAATGAAVTVLGVGNESKLKPKLDELAQQFTDTGVEITTRVEKGNPAQVLLDLGADYDLLVVGNKGMSGLERLMLGSVPNKLSHHLPCSLLIVRTGS